MELNSTAAGFLFLAIAIGSKFLFDQGEKPQQAPPGYTDTPLLPGGRWHVHDSRRPHPQVIMPGTCGAQRSGNAPSDAVVLFDGKDLSKWKNAKGEPAGWKVEDGYFEVVPKAGDIVSRDEFGDAQMHIEWATPTPPKGESQGRGNSGVFLMGRYEIQVLDSYENVTYADGQAAAIYGQYPPLANASCKPGQWQAYDIIFTPARFKDAKLEQPAYVTVLHNGVLVHNHAAILGPTSHRQRIEESPHEPKGPLRLQDHGAPVRYRNIWVRSIKNYDEP